MFTFDGPIMNIYATLVVRLSHSGVFAKRELWKNAATYRGIGGECGMFLREIEESHGELTLLFDEQTSKETRLQFEEYVYTHLQRRSVPESLIRRRAIVCDNCGFVVPDQVFRLLAKRGLDWVTCSVCGTPISLLDREEHVTAAGQSLVSDIDRVADTRRDLETNESIRQGRVAVGDTDSRTGVLMANRRLLRVLEAQQARMGDYTPAYMVLQIEDLRQELAKLES